MRLIKLGVVLLALQSLAVQAEIAVIVNPANTATVSTDDVSRLFLGRSSSFTDGSKANAVNLAEGSASRDEFDAKVLNRSAAQLKAYWSKLVFTGKGTPPKELADDAAMKAAVAADPTAIGYISSANVDDSVKVVATF